MQSLLLTVALVACLIAYNNFTRAPKDQRKKVLRTVLVYGGIGLVALLVLTGKLNPAIAAVGALIPLAQRAFSTWKLFRNVAGGSNTSQSALRSRHHHVIVEHETGRVDGKIDAGPRVGQCLNELTPDQLVELMDFYSVSDAQSSSLLQAYLDQRVRGWRERYNRAGAPPENGGECETTMTRKEASEILGVPLGASRDSILLAHKRLIQKLHPDRGGSSYLASKVNLARSKLLDSA